MIALCALRDVSLEQESNQLAIMELGGISILLNILKTDHWRCVVRSTKNARFLFICLFVCLFIYLFILFTIKHVNVRQK